METPHSTCLLLCKHQQAIPGVFWTLLVPLVGIDRFWNQTVNSCVEWMSLYLTSVYFWSLKWWLFIVHMGSESEGVYYASFREIANVAFMPQEAAACGILQLFDLAALFLACAVHSCRLLFAFQDLASLTSESRLLKEAYVIVFKCKELSPLSIRGYCSCSSLLSFRQIDGASFD